EGNLNRIPIASKFWRMKQRQELYDRAIHQPTPDYKEARGLLMDAARELGQFESEVNIRALAVEDRWVHIVKTLSRMPPGAIERYANTGEIAPEVLKLPTGTIRGAGRG